MSLIEIYFNISMLVFAFGLFCFTKYSKMVTDQMSFLEYAFINAILSIIWIISVPLILYMQYKDEDDV